MSDLININLGDTQNLLSYKSLLLDNPTINFNGGTVTSYGIISNELTIQKAPTSFKTKLVQDVTFGLSGDFDFGDALQYTSIRDGVYNFSFYMLKGDLNVNTGYNVDVKLNVFVNSVLTDTFVKNVALESGNTEDVRLAQSFSLYEGDVVNFTFEVQKDSVGTPNPNIELYFTGFQLNYGNISNYEAPKENISGWQSRVDTTNTQSLTANTDNTIAFTGTLESNGGLVLMNSNAKITPLKLGDFINVDFAFTAVTPSGTSNYLTAKFIVNGVAYRSESHTFLKGTGVDDNISVSYGFPVTADFLANGGNFVINPNVAVTIKNRYISVCRTHKGI
jgi:hypothetical protein